MIKSIKLKNFRNFDDEVFYFSNKQNFIVGENGKGKTNILEAISLLGLDSLGNIKFENLVKNDKDVFFIEINLTNNSKISCSFDKITGKKKFILNNKLINKNKLIENTITNVNFSPISMNLMYLSPSLRRDFLDSTLSKTFPKYSIFLQNYKKILLNRNKLLKNIRENKSDKSEINFWNKEFIKISKIIYNYRFGYVDFLKDNISESKIFFSGKINNIELIYYSKVSNNSLENDFITYLEKNIDRDIILGTTSIGPHIDDFNIIIDGIPLIEYASRGETKSIIIELKLLEIKFIEKYLNKKPVLLIDDLLSELDDIHKDMLLSKITNYQTFITSIKSDNIMNENIIKIN